MRLLRPRLTTVDTRRIRPAPKQADPYYGTPEHKAWSAAVIGRAGGRCQDPACKTPNRTGMRLFADHVVERQDGGEALDVDNGMARCGSCHTRKTAEERAKRHSRPLHTIGSTHPDWIRPSHIPLVVVCGAPAAGKTTYVAHNARPDDLIIDLPVLGARISGRPPHSWGAETLDAALRERNDLLGRLSWRHIPWPAAWLIVSEPLASKREWWAAKLKPKAIVVVETPADVCERRIRADVDRASRLEEHIEAAHGWWASYTPRLSETVVTGG